MGKRGNMPANPITGTTLCLREVSRSATGMTVREKFALKMATAMLSNPNMQYDPDGLAIDATNRADALLAELERTGGGCDE